MVQAALRRLDQHMQLEAAQAGRERHDDHQPGLLKERRRNDYDGPRAGLTRVWMKADGVLPDDPLLHVCVATFASDMTLLDSVLVRHGLAPGIDPISMASLDHAMWFQRPFRADEWMLYVSSSPTASGSRGLATGRFFDQSGRHLVSVVQEGLIRHIRMIEQQ